MVKLICKICGIEFQVKPSIKSKRKHCSLKCKNIYMKQIFAGSGNPAFKGDFIKKCLVCNKEFRVRKSRKNKAKYCSYDCYHFFTKRITGDKNHSWKGGKYKSFGYVFIHKPDHPFKQQNNYIQEHRLVMEKQVGRYLLPTESCHHINGIKDDNRIENLMLFASESAHQRFHSNPNKVKPPEIIFDGRLL